jgi:hypothetical protein
MFRRIVVSAMVLVAALAGAAGTARSEVRVNIGINLPAPPALVAVPATPVMYAPSVGANYFFYGGQYYVYANGGWYVGPGYNGPWVVVAPEFVPRPILAVPVRYYRYAPREWGHVRREGPPPWAPAWGRRWEDNERHHEGFREERHEGFRDERHGGFREERHGEHRDDHHRG